MYMMKEDFMPWQPLVDTFQGVGGGGARVLLLNCQYIITRKAVSTMTIADRIPEFKKDKRDFTEELADRIGVSRQAVSKWESKQSTPDVEKIILLSEYFGVTTDYLLKGIEPLAQEDARNNNVHTMNLVATAWICLVL